MPIAAARSSRADAAAERRALALALALAMSRSTKAESRQTSVGASTITKFSIFRWETIIESIVRT